MNSGLRLIWFLFLASVVYDAVYSSQIVEFADMLCEELNNASYPI